MFKRFGAIYLILGTCVAAGFLGLPIVTARGHLILTLMMLLSAWCLMTIGAWCLLQVNLWFDAGVNLLSMSEKTLGKTARRVTWLMYLILLYSLVSAYLAGSGDVLQALCHAMSFEVPRWLATSVALIVLGGIVLSGMRSIDLVNRFLMSFKLVVCVMLIAFLVPFVHVSWLVQGDSQWHGSTWLVMVCSFGYAIILPSLRQYLGDDKKQLSRVVMWGSLIPLVLYVVWIVVVQGALPRGGDLGLIAMNHSAHTNSDLMMQIAQLTHHASLQSISVAFISVCSLTGFLGVSICLVDFFADGLSLTKEGMNHLWLAILTYLPPMLIVLLWPSVFITALTYAGVCCLYILVLLPVAMYVKGKKKYPV